MKLRLGRISGIAINVDASWIIILAVVVYSLGPGLFSIYWSGPTMWALALATALLFFGSIILHELAHALVAQRHGIEVESITLFLLGGVARLRREPSEPTAELQVALAGPFASAVLVAVFAAMHFGLGGLAGGNPLGLMGTYLALVNLVVVIFNMIPAFPLDGGRVLRALIWQYGGSQARATRIATGMGQGFGVFLIMAGFVIAAFGGLFNGGWFVLVGWFLTDAARNAYAQTASQQSLSGIPLAMVLDGTPEGVPPDQSLQTLVDTQLGYQAPEPIPVVEDGRLAGLVGIPEVRRVARSEWPGTTVSQAMVPVTSYPTASPEHDAWDTLTRMWEQNIEWLVVLDNGSFLGVVSPRRLLQYARKRATA